MAAKPKTFADWNSLHNDDVKVPAKITAALITMLKEHPESWEYEGDFAKRAGVGQAQLAAYREQFKDHIVTAKIDSRPRLTWFADKKVAKKARGE